MPISDKYKFKFFLLYLSTCLIQRFNVMKTRILFLVLLAFFVLLLGCKNTEEITCSIYGYITSKDTEEGIENCRVSLGYSDPKLSVLTSSSGYYQIDNIPEGGYSLVISDKAYYRESILLNVSEYEYNTQFYTEFTDPRDQNTYKVVEIFDKIWMAENLNYGEMIDSSLNQTANQIVEKYCPENNESKCSEYGGYYQWNEAMRYTMADTNQGICPYGWRLPTYNDFWSNLLNKYYLGGDMDMYFHALIQPNNPHWPEPEDLDMWLYYTGFEVIPAGFKAGAYFLEVNDNAYFWTTNPSNNINLDNSIYFYLKQDQQNHYVSMDNFNRKAGFSIRCLKDKSK